MESICKFDIGRINDYLADEDREFGILQLEFLSDGYNSHGIPISTEVLKEYAKTILGKPIVAKYDKYVKDVCGHTYDECIVGYVSPNAQITFKQTENGLFACVDGVISKLYATEVYELYKTKNYRAVSVEMCVNYEDDDDTKQAKSFNITGVTLLGLHYSPSCTLANSKMTKFSKKDAIEFYDNFSQDNLQEFVKRRNAKLAGETYKINTKELKNDDWGSINKTNIRDKIMQASNRAYLVKKVYLKVEDGWEDAPSEHLKYPVMQLVGDTFYYNREALASAMAYAKQHNEADVVEKLNDLYDKFNLKEEGEKLSMEVDERIKEEDTKVLENTQELAEEDAVEDETKTETLEEAENEKDEEEPDEDKHVEMSLEEALQQIKELTFALEEKEKALTEQVKELSELREYKTQKESAEIKFEVSKTLEDIRDFVTPEIFESLQLEGEKCQMDNFDAWRNKACALGFEEMRKRESDTTQFRMSINVADKEEKSTGLWK